MVPPRGIVFLRSFRFDTDDLCRSAVIVRVGVVLRDSRERGDGSSAVAMKKRLILKRNCGVGVVGCDSRERRGR